MVQRVALIRHQKLDLSLEIDHTLWWPRKSSGAIIKNPHAWVVCLEDSDLVIKIVPSFTDRCHPFQSLEVTALEQVSSIYKKLLNNITVCVCTQSLNCVWFFSAPWTVAQQAPLPIEFSGKEYWCGLPFSIPEDLPN